jgi:hypothetical protein
VKYRAAARFSCSDIKRVGSGKLAELLKRFNIREKYNK